MESTWKFGRHPRVDLLRPAKRCFVQEDEQPGAGVLGIHVDGAARERPKRDLRSAEAGTAIDTNPASLEQLGEHLGEKVRFAEWLRGHDHWTCSRGLRRTREQKRRHSKSADHDTV